MNPENTSQRPWYKEPMFWLVVGIPLLSVCWGGVMLSLAMGGVDTLVSDSYYKDGVSYTENVEMDEMAARMGLSSTLVVTNDELRLTLDGYQGDTPPELLLKLIHPTLEDRDAELTLRRIDNGLYVSDINFELPSRRRIWLQSPEQGWRIRKTDILQADRVIQLSSR